MPGHRLTDDRTKCTRPAKFRDHTQIMPGTVITDDRTECTRPAKFRYHARDVITDDRTECTRPAKFRDHARDVITDDQLGDHPAFLRDHEPGHDHGDLSGGTSSATASIDRRGYQDLVLQTIAGRSGKCGAAADRMSARSGLAWPRPPRLASPGLAWPRPPRLASPGLAWPRPPRLASPGLAWPRPPRLASPRPGRGAGRISICRRTGE
jgi:hypothetical protein